jgi:hypothetical protein
MKPGLLVCFLLMTAAVFGCSGESKSVGSTAGGGQAGSAGSPQTHGAAGVSGGAGGEAGDPNAPDDDFLTPSSAEYVTLQFKGLINSESTVFEDSSNIMEGLGTVKAQVANQGFSLGGTDELYAYQYQVPDECGKPSVCGKTMTVVEARQFSSDASSTHGSMTYIMVRVPRDELTSLGEGENLVTADVGASVVDVEYVVRKDTTALVKQCYLGLADEGSKLFVDHSHNDEFAPGENLFVWGNAVEISDAATMADSLSGSTTYDGRPCYCYIDNEDFDCGAWDEEAAKEDVGLSCGDPPDFLDPTGTTYGLFRMKGPISDAGDDDPAPVYAEGSFAIDGVEGSLEMGYPTTGTGPGGAYLQFDLYGNFTGTNAEPSFDRLFLTVGQSVLTNAKAQGESMIPIDSDYVAYAVLMHIDIRGPESDSSYRICPKGILRPTSQPGRLYGCFDDNQTFGAGETIEIEGNLPMAADATGPELGMELEEDGCGCMNANNETIPCSTIGL